MVEEGRNDSDTDDVRVRVGDTTEVGVSEEVEEAVMDVVGDNDGLLLIVSEGEAVVLIVPVDDAVTDAVTVVDEERVIDKEGVWVKVGVVVRVIVGVHVEDVVTDEDGLAYV